VLDVQNDQDFQEEKAFRKKRSDIAAAGEKNHYCGRGMTATEEYAELNFV
jgi:hypothetical protein